MHDIPPSELAISFLRASTILRSLALYEHLEQAVMMKEGGGLVSKETVVLRRWGSETRKFGLSTELIM